MVRAVRKGLAAMLQRAAGLRATRGIMIVCQLTSPATLGEGWPG